MIQSGCVKRRSMNFDDCSDDWLNRLKKEEKYPFAWSAEKRIQFRKIELMIGFANNYQIFFKNMMQRTYLMQMKHDCSLSCFLTGLTHSKPIIVKVEREEWITLMIAANMNGTEKLPLLAIGKSARPRCLKNVRNLPVKYKFNKKASMKSDIFSELVIKLDREFVRKRKKCSSLLTMVVHMIKILSRTQRNPMSFCHRIAPADCSYLTWVS